METTRRTFKNPTVRFKNQNCSQEAGSPRALPPLTMAPVNRNCHRARVECFRSRRGLGASVLLVLLCAMVWSGAPANAQAIALTTVVVFADHAMPDAQWDALFTALRRD